MTDGARKHPKEKIVLKFQAHDRPEIQKPESEIFQLLLDQLIKISFRNRFGFALDLQF